MPEPIVDPANPDNPQNPAPQAPADNLPEKFKGKSAEEIASSYLELEKKFSETSKEAGLTKKQLQDLKALEQFIDNDPESLTFLKSRIQGKKQTPAQNDNPAADQRYDRLSQDLSDTKLATQASIFEKFEGKYGLNDSDADPEMKSKIGNTIKQMVNPKSSKNPADIIATIPLDTLPMYLENAYKLVTSEDQKEQTRRKTLAQARQNADATFSSLSSSSIAKDSKTLTNDEKKVARGLGLTEEKYLKQKQAIATEYDD